MSNLENLNYQFDFTSDVDTSNVEPKVNETFESSSATIISDIFVGDVSNFEHPLDFNDTYDDESDSLTNFENHVSVHLSPNDSYVCQTAVLSSSKLVQDNFPLPDFPEVSFAFSMLLNSSASQQNVELCSHLFTAHYGLLESAKCDLRKIMNATQSIAVIPTESHLSVNEDLVGNYNKQWTSTTDSFFNVDIDFQLKTILQKI